MNNEIQVISDGDGLAVIGDPAAVERFLSDEGLPSKELGLQRLGPALGTGAALMQAGSEIAASSGRWVKMTKESAEQVKKYGLMKNSKTGLDMGVVRVKGPAGIKGIVQFEKSAGTFLANPALLAGVAGIMAQLAMQQAMDEITDYLAAIDGKIDDVLRTLSDAVLADMVGVQFVIEEAMAIRDQVDRVSEVTWSKVQVTPQTIGRTQGYALTELAKLAEKTERAAKIGDLAETVRNAESKVQEWLAVLARCFQLQDAIAVLELDRVMDASPEELDRHRIGLKIARRNRMDLIAVSTERLLARMDAAAGMANEKVLFHPATSPAVVHSANHVSVSVHDFRERLGIESGPQTSEAKRWVDAAAEARDEAREAGARGIDAAERLGKDALGRARLAKGKLASGIGDRVVRRHGDGKEREEDEG